MNNNEWKLPLNLAIGFHILVALSAVFLPGLFNFHPKFEEIYTVDLINMAEPPPPAAAAPAAPKPAASKPAAPKPEPQAPPPKPVVPEKAVPVAESVPVETPAPPEAISIKPLKRKIKKELPPEPKPEPQKPKVEVEQPDPKIKEFDKLKRQKIAEAIRAEQVAQEEAKIASEEAENLRKILDATQAEAARTTSTSTTSQKSSSTAQASSVSSALEKSYYAAIFSRLHAFWSLPEFKEWDPKLTAVVVITINQNGEILDSMFEQRSGDKVFDQCVTKTLQDAAPLPPIPAALNKQRIEIGLRFTPGNIQ
jgi:colicin import membrane protein